MATKYIYYMKIRYAVQSVYDGVFLVNGVFKESIKTIEYPALSPLYVTTFPLSATLLPYTVRLVSGKATSNENLVTSYEVADGFFIVKLKERHNYVYSPAFTQALPPESGRASSFFRAVKSGDFEKARRMMTAELSKAITDDELSSFFAPFVDIVQNRFDELPCNYFLINGNTRRGEAYNFEFAGDKISNIEEAE